MIDEENVKENKKSSKFESPFVKMINPRLKKKKQVKPKKYKGVKVIHTSHSIHFGSPLVSHSVTTDLPYIVDSPVLQVWYL